MIELYQPAIYLFASVDIVDSTSMKYDVSKKNSTDWFRKFTSFYRDFPEEFKSNITVSKTFFAVPKNNNLELCTWKYAGDEILFYIKIEETIHIPCLVFAFEKTLQEWYTQAKEKNLTLKGCMWLGQTPYIDRILNVNNSYDFVGPSIDCGFRLGKYASKNHLVLSIEIVDICKSCNIFPLDIFYLKSENLKGVLGKTLYPIFILLITNADKTNEEKHLFFPCHETNLNAFITSYYKSLKKGYGDKVSRIDKPIPKYLEGKKEYSNNLREKESKFIEAYKVSVLQNKEGDNSLFKKLEDGVNQHR